MLMITRIAVPMATTIARMKSTVLAAAAASVRDMLALTPSSAQADGGDAAWGACQVGAAAAIAEEAADVDWALGELAEESDGTEGLALKATTPGLLCL
mmetsp:Transcript_8105/g.15170  ORF Transcript_8105/g.15170 Transcript_8105/m.15170 type:complete len:98 (-) Transcript_8105:171-464(-)